MAFRTKFFEVDLSSFAKKVLDKLSTNGFVGRGLRRTLLKILCSVHISSAA